MIDPWLFTAVCLGLLSACALVRVIRIPVLYDRLVAATVTVMLATGTGVMLGIGLGNILVVDGAVVLALLGFASIIAYGSRGEVPA
jgi:multisubunit Na+/H+ antiporter MnhF subunit